MQMFFSVLFLTALVAGIQAHMCLLSPRQRGTMDNINTHAAMDCYLTKGPCGGRPAGNVAVDLRGGQNFTVVLQKNASHRLKNSPGSFTVKFGIDSAGHNTFDTLATVPDMDDGSLSLYPIDVMIPMNARGQYVLQTIYKTNNPGAPAMFYQCADVFVI